MTNALDTNRRAYVHKLLAQGEDLHADRRRELAAQFECIDQVIYWDTLYYNAAADDDALTRILNRAVTGNRGRAAKYGVESTLTIDEAWDIIAAADGRCLCCQEFIGRQYLVLDHIKTMSNGGANSADNVMPLCYDCNLMKCGADNGARDIKTMRLIGLAQRRWREVWANAKIKKSTDLECTITEHQEIHAWLTPRQRTQALLDAVSVARIEKERKDDKP